MVKISVDDQYGPGSLAPGGNNHTVVVEVHGPAWAKADRVSLYANGIKIKEAKIQKGTAAGLKWKDTWNISGSKHDMFLVAIAEGPGRGMPYWPIAKPYQPASPEWTPRLMCSTGTVWIDGDKNGQRTSAYEYAKAILNSSGGDINNVMKQLNGYDEAVAAQVAALLWKNQRRLDSPAIRQALQRATDATKAGFNTTMNEVKLLVSHR
jgi:hypothetical protein